jgi:hypothetical protein
MPVSFAADRLAAIALLVACAAGCAPLAAGGTHAITRPRSSTGLPSHALAGERHPNAPRALPRTLYGVTVDDVSNLSQIAASSRHLPAMPVTRVYFDVTLPVSYYQRAISQLHPVSYLMGELLDSSDEPGISTAAFGQRVRSFLAAYGSEIDVWEIGNEVNGSWTGPYQVVAAKLIAAYENVSARHGRTALTLYYDAGCGDGPAELDPIAFTRRFVPPQVRNGLTYVFLSYYEGDCNGIRPGVRTWTSYFRALHTLYSHARFGFGEIGMANPVTSGTISTAKSMIGYYYGLPIHLPYYAGGYFWWYYDEDCLPYSTKPLWRALRAGFEAEAASQR